MSAFTTLPDPRLLAGLHELVRSGRTLEAQLLAHLAEVDKRRLYLGEACSSMFRYCVLLHFSEATAFKRIAAARATRDFPELLTAVRRGELHVTAVRLLAPHLRRENAAELIALARHQTVEQIERRLADRHPKPEVSTSVRRQAGTGLRGNRASAPPMEPPSRDARPGMVERSEPPVAVAQAASRTRSKAEPLGGDRYSIRFSASPETHAQLRELQAWMRHQIPDGDLAKILSHAVALLHRQVRKQKFADCDKPRCRDRASGRDPQRTGRQIPASIRRAVAKRDHERCTFVSPSGRRCDTRDFLEFHHEVPWGHEPSHEAGNITLRCRAHNQYAADRDFGIQHMAQFRRTGAPSSVGSPERQDPTARGTQQLALSPVRSVGSD